MLEYSPLIIFFRLYSIVYSNSPSLNRSLPGGFEPGRRRATTQRWALYCRKTAPAPPVAPPEGRAAITHTCYPLCYVSAALASFSQMDPISISFRHDTVISGTGRMSQLMLKNFGIDRSTSGAGILDRCSRFAVWDLVHGV